jgi:hypothetical protein
LLLEIREGTPPSRLLKMEGVDQSGTQREAEELFD